MLFARISVGAGGNELEMRSEQVQVQCWERFCNWFRNWFWKPVTADVEPTAKTRLAGTKLGTTTSRLGLLLLADRMGWDVEDNASACLPS
jgi:hypothetical protein